VHGAGVKEGGTSNRSGERNPRARGEYTDGGLQRASSRSDVPNEYQQAQPPPTPAFSLFLSLSYMRGETNFISAGVARARTRTTARIPFFLLVAPPAAVPNPGYGRSKWPGEKMPSSRIFSSRRETSRASSSPLWVRSGGSCYCRILIRV